MRKAFSNISAQYIVKDDDPTHRVLLPAWRFESLLDFFCWSKMGEARRSNTVVTPKMNEGWVEEGSIFCEWGVATTFFERVGGSEKSC